VNPIRLAAGLAAMVVLVSACGAGTDVTLSTTQPTTIPPPTTSTAAPATTTPSVPDTHPTMTVPPCGADTGYERARFGDEPSAKIRAAILTSRRNPDGTWTDAYTLLPIASVAGIELDHRVSLYDAWRAGACLWTDQERTAFSANPDNLAITVGQVSESKGDSGPGVWQPPNPHVWRDYCLKYRQTKITYRLSLSDSDLTGLSKVCSPTVTQEHP
jgi:hypothetical protein